MSAEAGAPTAAAAPRPEPPLRLGRAALAVLGVAVVAIGVRLPSFSFPMGYGAGKVGYVGRRWVAGEVPYRDVWDYQAPGLYLVGGVVVRALGPSPVACRAAMVAFDLGTLALVYLFARSWCRRRDAVAAAAVCALFGGGVLVQGDCLGSWPPMTFLVAASMVAAQRSEARRWGWLVAGGLAAGAAITVQPVAAIYLVGLAGWVVRAGRPGRRLSRFLLRPMALVLGAALPVGGFVLYFWLQDVPRDTGSLDAFWRSAVVYNAWYVWLPNLGTFVRESLPAVRALAPEQGALWLFAVGWVLHAFSQGFRRESGLTALWGLLALLAAASRRKMYPVDFHQTVPPLAVAAGLALMNPSEPFLQRDRRGRLESRSILLLLFAAALAFGFIYAERRTYVRGARGERYSAAKAAARVARLIRARTTAWDAIYVWGDAPQIYVLADRPAAHRIFCKRPLESREVLQNFFHPRVVDEIFQTLIEAQPCYFVTTEEAFNTEEHIARFTRGRYLPWGPIVEAEDVWFVIFARRDRAQLELPGSGLPPP
ncbi:MAG: phospholipid carrier-dependent glycosyltransferase [Candidatus Brocadiia bacterium]